VPGLLATLPLHLDPTLDSSGHWETVMRGHAAANVVPVIASNRIGTEEKLTFYGSSFICDHTGKVVQRASRDKSEVLIAKLDLQEISTYRRSWGLFRDRRPELYGEITTNEPSVLPQVLAHPVSNTLDLRKASPTLSTPRSDGFHMPAEWSVQRRVWIGWPHSSVHWRKDCVPAQGCTVEAQTGTN